MELSNNKDAASRGDANLADEGSSLIPLVESILELAKIQQQLVLDFAIDRHHERKLEDQQQQSQPRSRTCLL